MDRRDYVLDTLNLRSLWNIGAEIPGRLLGGVGLKYRREVRVGTKHLIDKSI